MTQQFTTRHIIENQAGDELTHEDFRNSTPGTYEIYLTLLDIDLQTDTLIFTYRIKRYVAPDPESTVIANEPPSLRRERLRKMKLRRQALGILQRDAAEALNVHSANISAYENGNQVPGPQFIRNYEKFLSDREPPTQSAAKDILDLALRNDPELTEPSARFSQFVSGTPLPVPPAPSLREQYRPPLPAVHVCLACESEDSNFICSRPKDHQGWHKASFQDSTVEWAPDEV